MPTVTHLEQDMHHAHISTHHLQHGQAHLRSGAPSSKASSVMSEDLSAVEDDEAAEEREMEQLMAAQQKEAADMQRRHTQQMQEKREAMTRRKLERKQSALGGSLGMGSASSMSSLGDHGPSSGRASIDGGHAQGAVSQHGAFVATGRPPKPASHQGLAAHAAGGAGGPAPLQGPAPPGATPPGSPGVAAGTHVAGTHVGACPREAIHDRDFHFLGACSDRDPFCHRVERPRALPLLRRRGDAQSKAAATQRSPLRYIDPDPLNLIGARLGRVHELDLVQVIHKHPHALHFCSRLGTHLDE